MSTRTPSGSPTGQLGSESPSPQAPACYAGSEPTPSFESLRVGGLRGRTLESLRVERRAGGATRPPDFIRDRSESGTPDEMQRSQLHFPVGP